ncbi:hypothetical protein EKK58_03040 [Candidatus Dependentiae bacterium]|nr:MAG: hypothetical protein EKK58_03040 [Candidatus Dependentiae bacterium]
MNHYCNTAKTIYAFLQRDWLIYKASFIDKCINYGLLWPIIFGFSFGVLRKNILFSANPDPYFGSIVLVGSVVAPMMIIAYSTTFDLMFDLESKKHVLFQSLILNPAYVLLEKWLFASIYTFLITILFFPSMQLILKNHFIIQNHDWISLIIFMFLACCAMCSLQQMCALFLKIPNLYSFSIRFNSVLMNMGGTLFITSPLLSIPYIGLIFFFNPILHITEGIRGILYTNANVIPFKICCIYLISVIFVTTYVSFIQFKKRTDHL